MKSQNPCSVCGAQDLNLIDGFYYCVECGTQDVNARETVVEIKEVSEGVLGNVTKTRVKVKKDTIEMSPEWTKWHTFNFILSGLGDELVVLGAGDSFKMRLLDVWARYMKIYYVKEDPLSQTPYKEFYEEDVPKKGKEDGKHLQMKSLKHMDRLCPTITYQLLVSMIYVALNLEKSDILLSHLQRFIAEGHIASGKCIKHIPKELNTKRIPNWSSFTGEDIEASFDIEAVKNTDRIRLTAMSILKKLEIGIPVVPDLRKIVDNCIKELCLPNDFKNLVLSLMELVPCDFLDLDYTGIKSVVRIPDYEGTVMAYVLVAMKMCFGIDDSYESQLCKDVDNVNSKDDREKSYKIGSYSNSTDRLFNFQEWCNYLQFRKIILSKYYLPIAQKSGLDANDYVFMEHSKERRVVKKTLHEEITMEVLDKLSVDNEYDVVPKSEFTPSLTPLTTYTDVVLQYLQDPDRKLLLSEDFTQYSLKYACVDLKLPTKDDMFEGVSANNFKIDKNIYKNEKITAEKADLTMIFIKNCENKNWLTTKQPQEEHVTKMKEDSDDNDHGYDSNQENNNESINKDDLNANNKDQDAKTQEDLKESNKNDLKNNHDDERQGEKNSDNDSSKSLDNNDATVISIMSDDTEIKSNIEEVEVKLEQITEEEGNIFDDDFADLYDVKQEIVDLEQSDINNQSMVCIGMDNDPNNDTKIDNDYHFDPEIFNGEEIVKELVLAACKEFRVVKPPEYQNNRRKRKEPSDEAKEIKRRRTDVNQSGSKTKPGDAKKEMDKILTAYYENLERRLLRNAYQNVFPPDNEVLNDDVTNNESINHDGNIEMEIINTELNSMEDNSRLESTVDSSCIVEGTLQDDDDNILQIEKSDPRYDEKIHDIRQLYLKFKDNFDVNVILKPDEELEKVIEQQIDKRVEVLDLEQSVTNLNEFNNEEHTDSFDEDDNIPLDKIKLLVTKSNIKNPCKEFLINEETNKNIKSYKYWQRIYPSQTYKSFGVNSKFYEDLDKEFPKSFRFVLTECASVVNSTPLVLYNLLQTIESKFAALRKRR